MPGSNNRDKVCPPDPKGCGLTRRAGSAQSRILSGLFRGVRVVGIQVKMRKTLLFKELNKEVFNLQRTMVVASTKGGLTEVTR
jgi:hypothetical protein